MTYLYSINLWIHVAFASSALILFWVPIFTKKGQLNHRKFGHYYKISIYTVAATGVVMASILINKEFTVGAEFVTGSGGSEQSADVLNRVQQFALFLIYLALFMFVTTRHGIAVLSAKENRKMLRTYYYIVPIGLMLVFGIGFLSFGMFSGNTLQIVFGILGIIISIDILKYCYRKHISHFTWVLEHIGNMIGSGIAAHTAFLVFGGRTLLSEFGQWQLVLWIAPGVIGGAASYFVCRRYAKLFNIGSPKELSGMKTG